MDAPLYPPSAVFVQPQRLAGGLSVHTSAISELMAVPAAWAIITEAAPMIGMAVQSPQMKPMLTTLSLRSLIQFGLTNREMLAQINAQLQALGVVS